MSDQCDPTPELDRARLSSMRDRLDNASGILACLDFDGTLADIVDDPDDARIRKENRRHLERLAASEDVVVAVVSGRSLTDLRDRVEIKGIHYAGNHGLEWDDGTGRSVAGPAHERRPALERAIDRLDTELSDVPGCTIEDKRLTVTVHYRGTPDDRQPEVVETAQRVAGQTDGVASSDGKRIVELKPDVPDGKDRVVRQLRERYPDHVPLFVGDDVTDEDGFRAVADDGIGVLVGDRTETAASVRIPDVDGVSMLLGWLVNVTAASDPP